MPKTYSTEAQYENDLWHTSSAPAFAMFSHGPQSSSFKETVPHVFVLPQVALLPPRPAHLPHRPSPVFCVSASKVSDASLPTPHPFLLLLEKRAQLIVPSVFINSSP